MSLWRDSVLFCWRNREWTYCRAMDVLSGRSKIPRWLTLTNQNIASITFLWTRLCCCFLIIRAGAWLWIDACVVSIHRCSVEINFFFSYFKSCLVFGIALQIAKLNLTLCTVLKMLNNWIKILNPMSGFSWMVSNLMLCEFPAYKQTISLSNVVWRRLPDSDYFFN